MIKFVSSILIISSLLLFTACGSIGDSVSTSGGGSTGAGGSNPTGGGSTTPTNQNYAPTIDKTLPNISLIENSGTTPYDINISDVDGDDLNLNIESNDTSILTVGKNFTNPLQQADYQNQTLDFNLTTAQDALGVVKITITVDDGNKKSIKYFNVNVKAIFHSGDSWRGFEYNTTTSPNAYANDINITIGGATKTYKVGTQRVWLDRNLGATRVCKDLNDSACFGDYYQWGRNTDGHEKITSSTIYTLAADISDVGHGKFIKSITKYNYDWTDSDDNGSKRSANWSKTDGTSICPAGYRVPTVDELIAEISVLGEADAVDSADVFNSFLKLPTAAFRNSFSGSLQEQGLWVYLWSSSVYLARSKDLTILTYGGVSYANNGRASGYPVRCIKD